MRMRPVRIALRVEGSEVDSLMQIVIEEGKEGVDIVVFDREGNDKIVHSIPEASIMFVS